MVGGVSLNSRSNLAYPPPTPSPPPAPCSIAVAPGDAVEEGQEVAVVEAMKMQNVLRAPRKGRVAAVRARPGDTLAVDQTIVEFE